MLALENNLHVMLFSDNVPLEQEIKLKKFARSRGLLVMGPDCARRSLMACRSPSRTLSNVEHWHRRRSGHRPPGSQLPHCQRRAAFRRPSDRWRDVKQEVAHHVHRRLKALAKDEQTRVILLVSKPPHPPCLAGLKKWRRESANPLLRYSLASKHRPAALHSRGSRAASGALSQAGSRTRSHSGWPPEMRSSAACRREASKRKRGQKYLRGLFSGGTFCAEAQILFKDMLANVHSNAPVKGAKQLRDSLVSQKTP